MWRWRRWRYSDSITPLPSISFSADPTSQLINNNVTLSWSSSNANSCSASGSWSGTKTTAGTEIVQITGVGNNSFTLSCSEVAATDHQQLPSKVTEKQTV